MIGRHGTEIRAPDQVLDDDDDPLTGLPARLSYHPLDPLAWSFGALPSLNNQIAARLAGQPQPAPAVQETPDADPTGQLWFGGEGPTTGTSTGFSDDQIGHIDSDGNGRAVALVNTEGTQAGFQAIGIDSAAGLYFTLVDGALRSGHITTTNQSGEASQIQETDMVFGSGLNADEVNALAVDPVHHVVYVGLWGQTTFNTTILKVTYNAATGSFTSPYNAATGANIADTSHMLLNNPSSGGKYTNAVGMYYDVSTDKIYYIDQTNGASVSGWPVTNGLYVVSGTSGSVGGGTAPTPVQLTTNAQFPATAGDGSHYISGFAVDDAKGLIYFTVNTPSPKSTTIYYMPIAGGTATSMSLPAGVTLTLAGFFGNGSNAMALDANGQKIYIGDNNNSHIIQLTLSADGHSFASGVNNFMVFDANNTITVGGTSNANALLFNNLPILNSQSHALGGTSTQAVQGGSAVTLLTGAAITITDSDGVHLGFATVKIDNAQTGDILASTNLSGTAISQSYNTATHVLTLSGDDTYAHYTQALNAVTYQDTGSDLSSGSHPTRSLTWTVSDGTTIASPTASDPNVAATIVTIDRPPTLVADNFPVLRGATVTGTSGTGGTGVFGNDSDLDADSFTITAVNASAGNVGAAIAGTYGHLTLNANGSYSYVADTTAAIDSAANGSHPVDTFTYTASDGLGGVSTQSAAFTIDRAPTVASDTAAAVESSSGTGNVLTNDSDRDGDTLTVSAVNGVGGNVGASVAGTYGHITIAAGGGYTYNADNTAAIDAAATGAHLTDTFNYTANDGHGGTTSSSIVITLDRPPTTANDGSGVLEAGAAATGNVLTNDSDRDNDSLVVSAIKNASNVSGTIGASLAGTYGHLVLNSNGTYSYAADITAAIDAAATGSHPSDVFTYTASDGQNGTKTATLTFAVDRPPVGSADTPLVFAGATKSGTAGTGGTGVLGNDTDKDGDTLAVTALTSGTLGVPKAGTYGHLTLNANGSYNYVADDSAAIAAQPNNAVLTDAFAYAVADGQGGAASNVALTFTVDQAPSVVSLNAAATSSADLTAAHTVTFTLSTGKNVVVAGGTTLALSDGGTASYVAGSGSQTITFSYSATHAPGALNVNSVASGSIADAAGNGLTLAGTAVDTYTDAVSDTAAHVSAQFDNLNAVVGTIASIALTDGGTPNLALSVAQTLNDTALIGTITSPYHLVVSDTAAHVQASLDGLQADAAAIDSIVFTDAGTPVVTITSAQQAGDAGALARLHGPYSLVVSDASGTTPEPGISGSASHYHAVEYDYDNTTALVRTVYFNDGGSKSVVAASGQTIDDSGSTTGDYFDLSSGGNLAATGGSGNDGFYFGANFTATDHVDGGAGGNNQIGLSGNYAAGLILGAATMTNIQVIACLPGFNYNLTTDDANVAANATLTIWAVKLAAANTLTFDGSAETDGKFTVFGGAGNDVIQGGARNDTFYGLGGADTFVYTAVPQSTGNADGTAYDTIDFDAGADRFDLPGTVTGIGTTVATGALSSASFDSDLAGAIGGSQLLAEHAVLFTPDSGTLATHTFLIVDANGIAGYQSGADYVFDVGTGADLASLGTTNFI